MHELSQRQLRVGELIKRYLSEMLQDPVELLPLPFDCLLNISYVRMSVDLAIAHAYVYPISKSAKKFTDEELQALLEWFKSKNKILRRNMGKTLKLRNTPELKFFIDTYFDKTSKITDLLQ